MKYFAHDVPTYEEMAMYNESFLEHFTDHLIMIFAFLIIGFMLTFRLIIYLHNNKFKVDYDLDDGTIMRAHIDGRKWLIVNPNTFMEWLDILILIFFDKGKNKDKFISKQDKKRVRLIGIFTIILITLFAVTGILMLFSASSIDLNPFNWLDGYRPWS